jgi:hypothetical protein
MKPWKNAAEGRFDVRFAKIVAEISKPRLRLGIL